MKKKSVRISALVLVFVLAAALFCSCSANYPTDNLKYALSDGGTASAPASAPPMATDSSYDIGRGMEDGGYYGESAAQTAPMAPQEAPAGGMGATPIIPAAANQKIIYSVYLNMETMEYDKSLTTVQDLTAEFGGYIQTSSLSGQGINNYSQTRYASYILRIPAINLNGFLLKIPAAGSITNQQNTGEDVSDQYFDTDAHLTTLKTTEKRLLSILEKTGELKDIIELENALSNTRYEIELLEGRLRRLDSHISYSTVTINLDEVMKYTPINEMPKTLGERISLRFEQSLKSIKYSFEDFAVWFVGGMPVFILILLVLAIIGFVLFIFIKLVARSAKKSREKNIAKYERLQAEYNAAQNEESPDQNSEQ